MRKDFDNSKDQLLETYYKQIKSYPLLSFCEELELSKKIQNDGDTNALHRLVNANLRLVVKIAKLFTNVHEASLIDLIQEGNLGLITAAQKYDYKKNVRFCTYSSWWIKQAISRYISNRLRIVRLPYKKEEMLRKIRRTYNILSQTRMSQPDNLDIAEELGIPVQELDYIVNMTSGPLPIEPDFYGVEAYPVLDVQVDYTYSPEQNFLRKSSRDGTMKILKRLKKHEMQILSYRYQLDGSNRQTLREISDMMDISPETVRQIEMRALKKIRCHANELKECVYTEAI